MGELLVAIGELLIHIFIYSILGAFKIVQFIFYKPKRKVLISEWQTSWRDKVEISIGGLLLVGFVSWSFWFFGSAIYEHYNPRERTLKEKILDKAFKKSIETDNIQDWWQAIKKVEKND